MNGGYVNNGRIVIECDVEIVNEDIRYPRVLTSRPDDDDVRLMLQEVGYIPTIKCIEMEVALNEISEDLTASHVVYIDGIPWYPIK
uniref:Tudor domain-containing protein n=1 Tax=Caenorhabditis tropicalis TaxID=1561998 RepID=A0A1I7T9Y2_9PELO